MLKLSIYGIELSQSEWHGNLLPRNGPNEVMDGSTSTVKKFYTLGSTTVAVRTISGTEDVLNWVLGDHYGAQRSTPVAQRRGLGSASVTATPRRYLRNADGSWNSEIEYCEASPKQSAGDTAFGEVRTSSGLTPTEYRYTGQLEAKQLRIVLLCGSLV
jgi:hypothetical protein